MGPIQIELLRRGAVAFRQVMDGDRLSFGRAPDNSVVLADEGISRHHSVLFAMDGLLWALDLGSRNGSFLNGLPLEGAQPVESGDLIRLGDALELRVSGAPPVGERRAEAGALLIEDEASGVRRVLTRPIAEQPLKLSFDGVDGSVIEIDEIGDRWLCLGDGRRWTVGERQLFEGRGFRLVQVQGAMPPTVGQVAQGLPLSVRATLDGASGAEAWAGPMDGSPPMLVGSGNRAVLIYLLARKLEEDRAAGLDHEAAGWCGDEELAIGIWGRAWSRQDLNGLHVLIYRVRKALEMEGQDGPAVEKRRKATRLNVARVELA